MKVTISRVKDCRAAVNVNSIIIKRLVFVFYFALQSGSCMQDFLVPIVVKRNPFGNNGDEITF